MARHLIFLAVSLVTLCGPARTQPAPYAAPLDSICSLGEVQSAGCDAIRARSPADSTAAPYSAIGRVNYAGGDIRGHCTGTLVSPRLVLTAGHCLWNAARKRPIPAESLRFAAGYALGKAIAVAEVSEVILSPAIDPAGSGFRVDPSHDWALLVLSRPLGHGIAPLPLFRGRLRLSGPGTATLAGYAGLTPHLLTLAQDCGQPLAVGGQLLTACSAMPGDSGAPLLWAGHDGTGREGLFVLGTTSAVSAATAPYTTRFAPWFRLSQAIEDQIIMGN